jgi:hypothetical protein
MNGVHFFTAVQKLQPGRLGWEWVSPPTFAASGDLSPPVAPWYACVVALHIFNRTSSSTVDTRSKVRHAAIVKLIFFPRNSQLRHGERLTLLQSRAAVEAVMLVVTGIGDPS